MGLWIHVLRLRIFLLNGQASPCWFARVFDTTGLLPRTNTLRLKIVRPGRTKRLSLTTTIDPFVFAGVFRRCNDLRVR